MTSGSAIHGSAAVSCISSESPCGLQERAQQNFEVTMGISTHEVTLDQLARQIAEVYEQCGFDRDVSMSTLQMLTNIEVRSGPCQALDLALTGRKAQRQRSWACSYQHLAVR